MAEEDVVILRLIELDAIILYTNSSSVTRLVKSWFEVRTDKP